jgi:hypothetical protein
MQLQDIFKNEKCNAMHTWNHRRCHTNTASMVFHPLDLNGWCVMVAPGCKPPAPKSHKKTTLETACTRPTTSTSKAAAHTATGTGTTSRSRTLDTATSPIAPEATGFHTRTSRGAATASSSASHAPTASGRLLAFGGKHDGNANSKKCMALYT